MLSQVYERRQTLADQTGIWCFVLSAKSIGLVNAAYSSVDLKDSVLSFISSATCIRKLEPRATVSSGEKRTFEGMDWYQLACSFSDI